MLKFFLLMLAVVVVVVTVMVVGWPFEHVFVMSQSLVTDSSSVNVVSLSLDTHLSLFPSWFFLSSTLF